MWLKGTAMSISEQLTRGHAGSHSTGTLLGSPTAAREPQDRASSLTVT